MTYRGEEEMKVEKVFFYWNENNVITIPRDGDGLVFVGEFSSIPKALIQYFRVKGKNLERILELSREGHDESYTEFYYSAKVEVS